jgi:hypothetical protein
LGQYAPSLQVRSFAAYALWALNMIDLHTCEDVLMLGGHDLSKDIRYTRRRSSNVTNTTTNTVISRRTTVG